MTAVLVPATIVVVDKDTGRGIPGVYITLDGIGGTTDSAGQVTLTVPPRVYTLTVRASGYMPLTMEVPVRGPLRLTLRLTRAVFR